MAKFVAYYVYYHTIMCYCEFGSRNKITLIVLLENILACHGFQ